MKETKNSGAGRGGVLDGSNPPQPRFFFFWNSPLLNGLNPNLGNIAYSGKFTKLGEKKSLIRQKKNTLSKIAAPGLTCSVSFEAVLLNKDESCIGQSPLPKIMQMDFFQKYIGSIIPSMRLHIIAS